MKTFDPFNIYITDIHVDMWNQDEFSEKALPFIIEEAGKHGVHITADAIEHQRSAWCIDLKSGYLDRENGYFLFSPCGCNKFRIEVHPLNGESWQYTYVA